MPKKTRSNLSSRKRSKTIKNVSRGVRDKPSRPGSNGFQMIYSNDDYNSNDGMLTSVWGPSMWHYLHTMSFNYPVKPTKDIKMNYFKFIYSLRNVLPCGKCRKNLHANFKKLPLKMCHMESRTTFSKYIYDLHELINSMLGKKSNLTYEMIRDRYEHFRARCVRDVKVLKPLTPSEKGCVEPLYGQKTKCVLRIVPQSEKCDTFQVGASL